MKWINVDLHSVWHNDDQDDIYKLTIEISQDWRIVSTQLSEYYSKSNSNGLKDLQLYIGHMIHDGNGSNGLLIYYSKEYEINKKFPERTNPWNPCQNVLWWICQAEVSIEYFKLIETKG